ncbi:MAG TPA: hypothetical protein VN901_17715 [Candidatus Acidoferrales bacterium]|nr:hypothetical protein [Candidatus Acidoferrales bacterium]
MPISVPVDSNQVIGAERRWRGDCARRPNKISMTDVLLLGRDQKLRINEGVSGVPSPITRTSVLYDRKN